MKATKEKAASPWQGLAAKQKALTKNNSTTDALRGWYALAATAKRNQQPRTWKRHRGLADLGLLALVVIYAATVVLWGGV